MELDSRILRRHMCGLRAQGLTAYIEALSDRPLVRCSYCGAEANSVLNICLKSMEAPGPAPDGNGGDEAA